MPVAFALVLNAVLLLELAAAHAWPAARRRLRRRAAVRAMLAADHRRRMAVAELERLEAGAEVHRR